MSLRVRTTPLADAQILEIDLWWRRHRDRAPELFEQELEAAFRTIGAAPLAGRRYRHAVIEGVRRVLMRRTRNHVYYVVRAPEAVVLAVWGAVKGSGPDLRGVGVD